MGALHEGHLSLLEQCNRQNDVSIVTIFVNPAQFNNSSDLTNYPKKEAEDLAKLEKAGCDLVFIPTVEEMYPEAFESTWKNKPLGIVGEVMEGKYRPGHFDGVVKVISRFFDLIKPNRAYFGLKDYQQYYIILQLAKNSFKMIDVIGCPTLREADGLAMSSRNLRLSTEERQAAGAIYQVLQLIKKTLPSKIDSNKVIELAKEELKNHPLINLEYLEVRDDVHFKPAAKHLDPNYKYRAFVSAFVGPVRLIDNLLVFP